MRFRLLAGLLALSLSAALVAPAAGGAEIQVKESRPRIWLDSAKLASLTRQVEARSPTWQKFRESPVRRRRVQGRAGARPRRPAPA